MIDRRVWIGLSRTALALAGAAAAAVFLGLNVFTGPDLPLLLSGWCVPAVALLHLVQQAGCGCAWHHLIDAPRPSRWTFFRIRWVRASIAALVPVSGVGAALVAVRLATRAGLRLDVASASLTVDATVEMISQIVFTALGFGLLLVAAPEARILDWAAATLLLAMLIAAAFVAAQRIGGMRVIEFGFSALARRWPRFSSLTEARLHDQLMRLHQRRRALSAAGFLHLSSWLLGAGEIWLILAALGHPASPAKCVIIESLSMVGRSAGFLIPGALGVQEVALVLVGKLVGLPVETAIVIAIVKRLRDVVVGVPGLLVWQWAEGFRFENLRVVRGLRLVLVRRAFGATSGAEDR
jgi:putative membrane protein